MTEHDREHLRLLGLFHYILAAITAFFGCFPLIHVAVGVLILTGAFGGSDDVPRIVGVILILIGALVIAMAWTLAALMVMCARRLKERRNFMFCTVVAAVQCAWVPLGTVLGVFTILVLQRPSVKAGWHD